MSKSSVHPHELSAAKLLAAYFTSEVTFLKPRDGYKQKTADLEINQVAWELKSPQTKSIKTLETRFREASHQSYYIVIDLRRIKIPEQLALKAIARFKKEHRRIKRVLCITRRNEVVEIQ